jgi:poly-beta-1,6-N-acetyl-D-glucosamine synthase
MLRGQRSPLFSDWTHCVIAILFWSFLFIAFYAYLGYGLAMYLLMKVRDRLGYGRSAPPPDFEPDVTLVIPAYNESDVIDAKVANCRALDYPSHRLTILFVIDGSDDGSLEALRAYPEVRVLYQSQRAGKAAAVNRAMQQVDTPITIFCDANNLLNPQAVRNLVRHFALEDVGCVAGEKRVLSLAEDQASGAGESLYWRYESAVKRWESTVGSVMGAAGELFAIRTSLFRAFPADTLLDDFILSLGIAAQGYRLVYEDQAIAFEQASTSIGEEWKRKVRNCAGGLQAILRLWPLLNPFRYGFFSIQYISHRVLRWTVTPLFLALLLPMNLWLAMTSGGIYRLLMAGQLLFYIGAWLGWRLETQKLRWKPLFIPFYFVMMNLAVFAGLLRFLRKEQTPLWERAQRRVS